MTVAYLVPPFLEHPLPPRACVVAAQALPHFKTSLPGIDLPGSYTQKEGHTILKPSCF